MTKRGDDAPLGLGRELLALSRPAHSGYQNGLKGVHSNALRAWLFVHKLHELAMEARCDNVVNPFRDHMV